MNCIKENPFSISNTTAEVIDISSAKINQKLDIKIQKKEYHEGKIELKNERSNICKINSKYLSDRTSIKKIYTSSGIVASVLDCCLNCINIINNNNYSTEEKCKEILKEIVGTLRAVTGVPSLSKLIRKVKEKGRKMGKVNRNRGARLSKSVGKNKKKEEILEK
jgi:hypothetical protein